MLTKIQTPTMVSAIALAVRRCSLTTRNEMALHDALETVFKNNLIPYSREYIIPPRYNFVDDDGFHGFMDYGRVDFCVGHSQLAGAIHGDGPLIGVEVKIAGSLTAVTEQLKRYAASKHFAYLILITTKSTHQLVPQEMSGVPCTVIRLENAF